MLYIESLVGPDTVNTVPPATLDAFRDHGSAQAHLEDDIDQAKSALAALEAAGISLDAVTDTLLDQGVEKFVTLEGTLCCRASGENVKSRDYRCR